MEQLKLVSDLGCNLVQGYIFSTPMQEETAVKFLSSNNHSDIIQELQCLTAIDSFPRVERNAQKLVH